MNQACEPHLHRVGKLRSTSDWTDLAWEPHEHACTNVTVMHGHTGHVQCCILHPYMSHPRMLWIELNQIWKAWTHSLMVSSMSSKVATLRILVIIPLSLSPLMNCYVSSLSYSLYWYSAAFVLSLPIHSWASLLFLGNVWYCSNITILLCCGLNLLHNTEKTLHSSAFLFFFLSECLY